MYRYNDTDTDTVSVTYSLVLTNIELTDIWITDLIRSNIIELCPPCLIAWRWPGVHTTMC